MIAEIICIVCIVLGLIFFLGTNIGLFRFPDFYTRVHAAGKGDTFSTFLLLTGIAVYQMQSLEFEDVLVGLKILAIVLFIAVGSPTATHIIMNAGYRAGVKHWTREGEKEKEGRDDLAD